MLLCLYPVRTFAGTPFMTWVLGSDFIVLNTHLHGSSMTICPSLPSECNDAVIASVSYT